MARKKFPLYGLLALLAASILAAPENPATASSHGDSAASVQNASADISDFYMFRSFESGQQDRVVFIMNVRPFQEPGAGPTYYPFDDTVTYNINIDIDQDGAADDVIYQVRFQTQFQPPFDNLPISYAGTGFSQVTGISPAPVFPGTTTVIAPTTPGTTVPESPPVIVTPGATTPATDTTTPGTIIVVPPATTGTPGASLDSRPTVPRLSLGTPAALSASPASTGGTMLAQADGISTGTTGTTTEAAPIVVPGTTGAGIRTLSGSGSEGLGLRQTYTVTRLGGTAGSTNLGTVTMSAVPPRVGPRTTPDYEPLSDRGIFTLSNGGRVFAGPRDDAFYADLGAFFDTFNFRANPAMTGGQDGSDTTNPFGFDTLSGYNVNTVAIEVPISDLTSNPNAVIGAYASTTKSRTTTLSGTGDAAFSGPQVQVSRAGNPLVADLIIGNSSKALWNMSNPENEEQFIDFYRNPRLARLLASQLNITVPNVTRDDLPAVFLKYPGQDPRSCAAGNVCSELLRLDLAVSPAAPSEQSRLGSLTFTTGGAGSPDPAGWPNGRRPGDDVLDIFLRLIAGERIAPAPALGDGVNFNIGAEGSNLSPNGVKDRFPFLPIPHDGRDRRHIDPGETP